MGLRKANQCGFFQRSIATLLYNFFMTLDPRNLFVTLSGNVQ